jgi:hypothetical protein
VRRTWWVATLFALPSLLLTLLVNAALSLERGLGSPIVWLGLLVVPVVGTAGGERQAIARGLGALGALGLLFAAIVYLRIWTDAGRQVIAREGLDRIALGMLVLGAAALLASRLLSRRGGDPGPRRPGA